MSSRKKCLRNVYSWDGKIIIISKFPIPYQYRRARDSSIEITVNRQNTEFVVRTGHSLVSKNYDFHCPSNHQKPVYGGKLSLLLCFFRNIEIKFFVSFKFRFSIMSCSVVAVKSNLKSLSLPIVDSTERSTKKDFEFVWLDNCICRGMQNCETNLIAISSLLLPFLRDNHRKMNAQVAASLLMIGSNSSIFSEFLWCLVLK